MFTNLMKWYYPQTIDEALALLKKGKVVPHAGGTGLLRVKSNRIRGLVDLRELPLMSWIEDDRFLYIGAGVTLAKIAKWDRLTGAASILKQASSMAASTPLRNRITIGGSVAQPPPWSDFPPVLLALDAQIEIKGSASGLYSADQYFRDMPLDGTSLVTQIQIPKLMGKAAFERVTRTKFDYSMLDLAIYLLNKNNKINEIRIAIGCAVSRAMRLVEIEGYLLNNPLSEKLLHEVAEKVNFNPSEDLRVSKEYRQRLLKILLYRNLKNLLD